MNAQRRRLILMAGIVAVMASAGIWKFRLDGSSASSKNKSDSPSDQRVTMVKLYKVRPRKLESRLVRNGTVRAAHETSLQFGAAGRIMKFDVEKGWFVKKGALIAQLDPAEARTQLESAELDFQKASIKYFQDRTIDKIDYERAKMRYNQAKREFDKTVLRAPHRGYLVEKAASVGEHVTPGLTIGKLMDKSEVYVELSLSERDTSFLKESQEVEVTVDALPDYRGTGRVVSITPYLEGHARSFAVKVSLPDNPHEALNPGMFARCVIRQFEKDDALVVPSEAVVESAGEPRIFTVDESNRVTERVVAILHSNEKESEIGNVTEGDLVILDPPVTLRHNAQVSVVGVFDPLVDP